MKIVFDEDVAYTVFSTLTHLWENKVGVFRNIVLPQDKHPRPTDPREHALWLFYASLGMRGGILSEEVFKIWAHAKENYPEIFLPEKIVTNDIKSGGILERLKSSIRMLFNRHGETDFKGYKLEEISELWLKDSLVLLREWDGNPLNIFVGIKKFEEAFFRIDHRHQPKEKGLSGIRRKIFSLYIIWLQEAGLIPIFPTPLPVDFHTMRIFFANNIARVEGTTSKKNRWPEFRNFHTSEKITDALATWSEDFMSKHGFSHWIINPALWVWSREMCSENFQNRSWGNGAIVASEEDILCGTKTWPKNYQDPCGKCTIGSSCKYAIPSGPYYTFGSLVLIKRIEYLPYQLNLFSETTEVTEMIAKRNLRK